MIKKLTKRLGRSSVLALVALAAIVTTGSGCDENFGAPASPSDPKETTYWFDGYEFVIWDVYY